MRMLTLLAMAATALVLGGAGMYAYSQSQTGTGPTDAALEALRERVMDHEGTEPPYNNAYWDNHAPGLYVEARTAEPLFSSADKYDSGTGWPSFTRPLDPSFVTEHADVSGGMTRVEVRSRGGNAHLGHVFNDGPQDRGGKRYCMNSAALRFIPRERMQAEGFGAYLRQVDARAAQTGE